MLSQNMLDLIGNTPLVLLDRINPNSKVSIYAKLESNNPSGSLKDRIAKYMIESAEKKGLLDPKKTIIEATSGNTGIALGMVCAVKGYKCKLFMLESKSLERRFLLRYWGAELVLTTKDDADSHIYAAKKLIAEEPDKYFYIDQNENEDNVLAHYNGTGKEIVKDLDGKVDAFIAGFGTGGVLMGVGRALKEAKTGARIISVEPGKAISKIDGLKFSGEGYTPTIYHEELIDETVRVSDEDAIETGKRLSKIEGIMGGISSGATVWAALQTAKKMDKGNIVVIIGDRGERYFSTALFDEAKKEN
jgi:cysteine synthase